MQRFHHDDETCGHGHAHGAFPPHGFRPPFGMHARIHAGFGGPGGQRARRGDVRSAILRLLAEQPMHGYQIIQELSARSGGAWRPSAGSIYPALQLLADEGMVTAEETTGKKIFSLTEAGKALVAETADQPAPWDEAAQSDVGVQGYREAAGRLVQAVWQIGKTGSPDQIARGIAVLTETRKQLYAILAED